MDSVDTTRHASSAALPAGRHAAAGDRTAPPAPPGGHLLAFGMFLLVSVWLTWPLVTRLSTHVPGATGDDNMVFLWNVWWMRHVLASEGLTSFLHTRFMFFPGGADLVLHTHTALMAFVDATILGGLPAAAALNVTLLVTGALNGFSAYLLAWRATAHLAASIVAGVFFAASPVLVANLFGHFNFYGAWGLGLFAWALLETLHRASWRWAMAAGLLLAAVAYTDYYYFVYLCALTAVVLAQRWARPRLRVTPAPAVRTGFDRTLLAVAVAGFAASILIHVSGGLVFTLGGVRVSLTTGTNLRAVATAAFLFWLWRRRRPVLSVSLEPPRVGGDIRLTVMIALVAGVLVGPLAIGALGLWRDGQYVTQAYAWRSAPAGVDAGTLLAGNPFNALWGAGVMRAYAALGMSPFDGPLWMGAVPVVLLMTWRRWRQYEAAALWLLVGAIFLVWALGPYLLVFGMNTGLPLPQILLRYVPVVSNARIPSHAAVLVLLSSAILLAMAIATLPRARRALSIGILAAVVADAWAAPFPLYHLDEPPVYVRLATLPAGGVLEIPFGIRDGFGASGSLDPRILYYQTLHRKPIVSGYISRLSPAVTARYASPVFAELLRLSAANAPQFATGAVASREAGDVLKASGVRYVVINSRTATPAVQQFVLSMPLRLVLNDGTRQLYEMQ